MLTRQSLENRVRHIIARWQPIAPMRHAVNHFLFNISSLQKMCRPCVASIVFKCVWNGIPTSWRMRQLPGVHVATCLFGCEHGVDKLEHYVVCPIVWNTFGRPPPLGINLKPELRNVPSMMLLERRLDRPTLASVATCLYAVCRTMHCVRLGPGTVQPVQMLRIQANEGTNGQAFKSNG